MQYDFALTPLGGQIINAKGRFFKYRAGNGLIRVKLTDGGVIDLLPGQGVSNRNFESIEIVDKSGAANSGTILAGDFDFRDERISGTVDVVDGGKTRTLANTAFMVFVSSSSAGLPSENAHAQLFNPSNSGKNVIVEAVTYSAQTGGTTGGILIFKHNAALATLVSSGQSKKADGPVSAAKGYKASIVGPVAPTTPYLGVNISVNTPCTYKPSEPIILPPGYGLVMMQTAGGADISASFEYYEEPL